MSKRNSELSRRGALILLGTGTALVGSGTLGMTHLSSDRGASVDVGSDQNAGIGLLSGPSSLLVSNNLEKQVTVDVSPNDPSTVIGSTAVTLDPRTTGQVEPGTHPFLFNPDDLTSTFDVTVTVTAPGLDLQTTKTIPPAADLPADNAVQLLIKQTVERVHTWNVADAASTVANVNEIVIDYSGLNNTNTASFLDNTRAQDVAVGVNDSTETPLGIRVDRSVLDTAGIGGAAITIPLVDTFNFDNTDMNRLLVSLGRLPSIDSAENGSADLTVRDGSGGSATVTVNFDADVSYA